MKLAAKGLIIPIFLTLSSLAQAFELNSLEPGIDAGSAWTFGNMESPSGFMASRGVQMLSFHAFPHLKISPKSDGALLPVPLRILGGPLFEYRFVGQLTDPAMVNQSNYRGSGYLLGIGASLEVRHFSMLVSYDFFGIQSISKLDATQSDATLGSVSGIRVFLGYSYLPTFSIDLILSRTSYNQYKVGEANTNISGDPLRQTMIGIGTRVLY